MRGDLQHAVGRRIADRLQARAMGLAQFGNDLRAGSVAIAQNSGQASLLHQRGNQSGRKARLRVGKIAPGKIHRATGHFPMAGGRVLAGRSLHRLAPSREGAQGAGKAWRQFSARSFRSQAQPEHVQMRQLQNPGPQAKPIRLPGGASLRDMQQRIGPRVAIGLRIRRAANADRIQHDEQRPGHVRPRQRAGVRPRC